MKATEAVAVLVLASTIFCGCATHHKLARPVASLAESVVIGDAEKVSELEKAMTDKSIVKLLELEVRAKLPTTLAVAKLRRYYDGSPSIEQISAEELKQWQATLPESKLITGVQYISRLMVEEAAIPLGEMPGSPEETSALIAAVSAKQRGRTLRSLRVAAAKMRCELLLVYVQGDSTVNNYNDLAALYWSFVGLWLVPGNVLEHRTIMQAAIVDTRTGAILGTAVGDAHMKQAVPMALQGIARDKMSMEAPRKTLADLQKGCKEVLAEIVKRSVEKTGK
ncbi:MAG: hypothetical protein ACYTF6_10265 [Planctomycetota bacterium]|jgi:hypothetical protein